jgi:hypothetical protein
MKKFIISLGIVAVIGAIFVSTPTVSAEKVMSFGNSSRVNSSSCSESTIKEIVTLMRTQYSKEFDQGFNLGLSQALSSPNMNAQTQKYLKNVFENKKVSAGMDLVLEGALEEAICNKEFNTTGMTADQVLSLLKLSSDKSETPAVAPLKMIRL